MTLAVTGGALSLVWWFLVFAVAGGAVLGSLVVSVLSLAGDRVLDWLESRRLSRGSGGSSGSLPGEGKRDQEVIQN